MAISKNYRRALAAAAPAAAITALLSLPVTGASAATTASVNGTATLSGGNLTLTTAPTELNFGTTALNGAQVFIEDSTATGGDSSNSEVITDATGTGDGWDLTAGYDASTGPFSDGASHALDTLSTNGSASSQTATTAPADSTTATETGVSYPVTLPSTETDGAYPATTIFNAAGGSGQGVNTITNQDWWLEIPATAYAGTYTTTLDLSLNSGPTG